ncbi:MAG TPA: pentapeptide repeat-containing protein [Methanothrix sp.]|nr:pentapeptide repeat-containing protein [Methanothrix sp.]
MAVIFFVINTTQGISVAAISIPEIDLLESSHTSINFNTFPTKNISTINAEEVIAMIVAGKELRLDNVIIIGNLNLSSLYWPDNNRQKMVITNSKILGYVDFSGNIFNGPVNFSGTVFLKVADFVGAQFNDVAYFQYAQFKDNAYFSFAQFKEKVFFFGTKFDKNAYFPSAQFGNKIYFSNAQIKKNSFFGGSQFLGDAHFENISFFGNSFFAKAQFSENVRFVVSKFCQYADFGRAQFEKNIDFEGAKFENVADFEGAQVRGVANFKMVWFAGQTYFQWSQINNGASFETARFDGDVYLNAMTYTRMYLPWDLIKNNLVFNSGSYFGLVNNYRALNWLEDANNCYYKYRTENQQGKSWIDLTKYLDIFLCISSGYGLYPERLIYFSGIVILFFACIYRLWNGIYIIPCPFHAGYCQRLSFIESLYFSCLIYFTSNSLTTWQPSTTTWRYIVIFEDIMGWMFLGVFISIISKAWMS